MQKSSGLDTQARRILGAMYVAINVVSLGALQLPPEKAKLIAVPVFGAQIIYKTITAFINIKWNQVIYANQFVTAVHLYTLHCMHKDGMLDVFLR